MEPRWFATAASVVCSAALRCPSRLPGLRSSLSLSLATLLRRRLLFRAPGVYTPKYLLQSFTSPAITPAARQKVIGRLLDVLVHADDFDLAIKARPRSSSLRLIPSGETWQDTARVAQLGGGTIPSLVAYRIAELHRAGERGATWAFQNGTPVVKRANGSLEDPSRGSPWATTAYFAAMWTPTLEFLSFETTPAQQKMDVICKMLAVLHETNAQWFAAGGKAPPLYQSGVKYQEEQLGHDEWQDIPRSLDQWTRGVGSDCEDLASWRVSELRFGGEDAWHTVEHRKSPTLVLYHIRIRRQDGSIEDPSCRLGMSGACSNLVPASKVGEQTAGAGGIEERRTERPFACAHCGSPKGYDRTYQRCVVCGQPFYAGSKGLHWKTRQPPPPEFFGEHAGAAPMSPPPVIVPQWMAHEMAALLRQLVPQQTGAFGLVRPEDAVLAAMRAA